MGVMKSQGIERDAEFNSETQSGGKLKKWLKIKKNRQRAHIFFEILGALWFFCLIVNLLTLSHTKYWDADVVEQKTCWITQKRGLGWLGKIQMVDGLKVESDKCERLMWIYQVTAYVGNTSGFIFLIWLVYLRAYINFFGYLQRRSDPDISTIGRVFPA